MIRYFIYSPFTQLDLSIPGLLSPKATQLEQYGRFKRTVTKENSAVGRADDTSEPDACGREGGTEQHDSTVRDWAETAQ